MFVIDWLSYVRLQFTDNEELFHQLQGSGKVLIFWEGRGPWTRGRERSHSQLWACVCPCNSRVWEHLVVAQIHLAAGSSSISDRGKEWAQGYCLGMEKFLTPPYPTWTLLWSMGGSFNVGGWLFFFKGWGARKVRAGEWVTRWFGMTVHHADFGASALPLV